MSSNTDLLQQLAQSIFKDTRLWQREGEMEESLLPSAADLARQLGYRLENVKKGLRTLKESGLIQPTGHMPKRYRFDEWIFRSLTEDHPFYEMVLELDQSLSPVVEEFH